MARRSVLFTPGDRPGMMEKALGSEADVVVFDLEDGVAPDAKVEARESVEGVLSEVDVVDGSGGRPEVWVRANPLDAGGRGDLTVGEPSCFVVPKAADAATVESFAAALDDRGSDAGLVPVVETAAGVLDAGGVAAAPRVSAVVFGAEDLAADVGATRSSEGEEVVYARQRVVVAAAAAGVDAVDTLWTEFEDVEGLRADARRAVDWGFDGKLVIHPAQVEPVNEAFTPPVERVEWAERVVEAAERAAESERGVFEVDGEMVDAPLVTQAERVLERARAAGIRD